MCSWTFHKYSETAKNKSDDIKDEFSIANAEDNVAKNRDQKIIPGKLFTVKWLIVAVIIRIKTLSDTSSSH